MPNTYTAIIGHQGSDSQWEEKLAIPDGTDPEAFIREMIVDFNEEETERYGDGARLRKFISVDMTSGTLMCSWTRANAVTLADRKGMYNLYRCEECRLTVRISEFGLPGEKECHPERVCTTCNKEFVSDKNLAKHMARQHPEEF